MRQLATVARKKRKAPAPNGKAATTTDGTGGQEAAAAAVNGERQLWVKYVNKPYAMLLTPLVLHLLNMASCMRSAYLLYGG